MGEKKARVRNGLSSSSILHHQSRILDYVAFFYLETGVPCLALARCHADPEHEPEPEHESESEPESEPELEPEPSIQ